MQEIFQTVLNSTTFSHDHWNAHPPILLINDATAMTIYAMCPFMSDAEYCPPPHAVLVPPLRPCHWRVAVTNEMRQEQGVMNLFLVWTSTMDSSYAFHSADHMTPRGQYWHLRQRQLRGSSEGGMFKNKSKLIQVKKCWPQGFWYLKAANGNRVKKILHSQKSTNIAWDWMWKNRTQSSFHVLSIKQQATHSVMTVLCIHTMYLSAGILSGACAI